MTENEQKMAEVAEISAPLYEALRRGGYIRCLEMKKEPTSVNIADEAIQWLKATLPSIIEHRGGLN